MNHIYKIVFNKATNTFTAVAEYVRGHAKSSSGSVIGQVARPTSGIFKLSTLVMSLIMAQGAWAEVITAGELDLITIGGRDIGFYAEDNQNRVIFGKGSKAEDRFGDDMYNMNLSLLRAQTVRSYLVLRGVDAGSIWATGAGETQPVKQCADNSNKKVTIDCLQPNRRVEVQVSVY